MNIYSLPIKQTENTFVFLRVMLYKPYKEKLGLLKSKFTNNSELFFYLILKYHRRLEELVAYKNSSKKKYQEITKNYSNIGLRVSPAVHEILKILSDATGYSMSAIVRFLIEWEFLERNDTLNIEGIQNNSSEIVITSVNLWHRFLLIQEKVEEDFLWGFY